MYYVRLFLNSEILYVTLCRKVRMSNGEYQYHHIHNYVTWQLVYR